MLVQRSLPENLKIEDQSLFSHEFNKEVTETANQTLNNVHLNSSGYLWKRGKIKNASTLFGKTKNPYQGVFSKLKFFIKYILLSKKIKIESPSIWSANEWSSNYFHWLTEAIPKTLSIIGEQPAKNFTLLLPKNLGNIDFIKASLQLVGIKNITYLNFKEVAFCKQLSFSSVFANTGNYETDIINKTRAHLQKQLDSLTIADKKIFISRKNADKRKIKNEAEIEAILVESGFEILIFEHLSFIEQAKLSYQCKYLISNHGAGLTNMLFMNAGSSVLELRHKNDSQNNCYFSLASALNHYYFYQLCDADSENLHQADLTVDANEFKKNINLMLNRG